MKTLEALFFAGVGIAAGMVSVGFVLGAYSEAALVLPIWAAAWIVAYFLHIRAADTVGILVYILILIFYVWSLMPFAWAVAGLAGAMTAWDVWHLLDRLREKRRIEPLQKIIRNHLLWLGGTLGVGAALAFAGVLMRLRFSLVWELALGALVLLVLGNLISIIRRSKA